MPGKEKVVSTRICGETSCNQILARLLLVKSPTKGLNVLKIPFREVNPNTWLRFRQLNPSELFVPSGLSWVLLVWKVPERSQAPCSMDNIAISRACFSSLVSLIFDVFEKRQSRL